MLGPELELHIALLQTPQAQPAILRGFGMAASHTGLPFPVNDLRQLESGLSLSTKLWFMRKI